jgi:predicted GNAT superfamily acetyltransferase
MRLRDISSIEECRAVTELQVAVWGRDSEVVPASVLFVSAKRGGILIGAYSQPDPGRGEHGDEDGALVGFVWSMPGRRNGRPTHWSHMLGVAPGARGQGVGEALKWAQRERVIEQGVDLIEWTFDPLQAPNAHLNFARLGAVATTYLVNAYGEMTGPLHRGTPTDRLIAEWWVTQNDSGSRFPAKIAEKPPFERKTTPGVDLPHVIATHAAGDWRGCGDVDTGCDSREVLVPVPARFTEMQQREPDLARAWRQATRVVFTAYFRRGYRAVDFILNREQGDGAYLLTTGNSQRTTDNSGPS